MYKLSSTSTSAARRKSDISNFSLFKEIHLETVIENKPVRSGTATLSSAETSKNIGSSKYLETKYQLGLWLASIDCFFEAEGRIFGDNTNPKGEGGDYTREFRLAHSALLNCSRLSLLVARYIQEDGEVEDFDISDLSLMLRSLIVIDNKFTSAPSISYGEWSAWKSLVAEKLGKQKAKDDLTRFADSYGESFLPQQLLDMIHKNSLEFSDQADLKIVASRFGSILRSLHTVRSMLRNDEPLKQSLLIFAKVYFDLQELVAYINSRLQRFPNEDAEMFGTLDASSYTASIELKKVFTQELAGIVDVRQSPSVYARVETAYASLNDSLQQILTGFAKTVDPAINAEEIFPSFKTKQNDSERLYSELQQIADSVREAEQDPAKMVPDDLNIKLTQFLNGAMGLLFYKDQETFERFAEEIIKTGDRKDLVPILHRFGAYLETLCGQVSMRVALAHKTQVF